MQVIKDVCVIPMRGDERLPHHDVLVEGAEIVAVEPTGGTFAEAATVVDGAGRFLIPGLIDTHVHYSSASREPEEGIDTDALNRAWLDLCLANGVTTTLCLDGFPELLELRDRVLDDELAGPTIHTSGPIQNDPTMTYEQALAEVAEEAEIGYSFVKVYNELTKDAYRGLTEAAERHGLRVLGHVPRDPGFAGVLSSNQMAIVHGEELLYTAFELQQGARESFRVGMREFDWKADPPLQLAELPRVCSAIAEAGMTMIPNMSALYAIWQQSEDTHAWHRQPEFECLPPRLVDLWVNPPDGRYVQQFATPWCRRNLLEGFWFLNRLVDELRVAGVPMTAGTDWGIPGTMPGLLRTELRQLAVAGLGNDGALRAATQAGGELLEPGTGLGLVAPGSRADLVLLDADPLEDVRNVGRIVGVMTRGGWHWREELDERVSALRASAAAERGVTQEMATSA